MYTVQLSFNTMIQCEASAIQIVQFSHNVKKYKFSQKVYVYDILAGH